ncbi:General transcription factor II-I repeat domain-containing protein 2 [Merluccius polli]|uniref:General transcription factor II-I repeat domain-containing protein 2 n=1 Tax=Merluccius polli TaxID=89951 RepID=A0AA47N310_MERPO|nr:General transcription factor II-I repeat domain-containing protein 2 [Merluccius polli]
MTHKVIFFPSVHFAERNWAYLRFANFEAKFELLSNPFAVDVEKAPMNIQMELLDFQCSDTRRKCDSVVPTFHPRNDAATPPIHAAQMLCMFGSTYYLCEQLFSVMKMNKTSHRSRLSDGHLHSILRIATDQSLTPDIDASGLG